MPSIAITWEIVVQISLSLLCFVEDMEITMAEKDNIVIEQKWEKLR